MPVADLPPIVVISYYDVPALPRLVRSLERARMPKDATVLFGSYHGMSVRRPPGPPPPRPKPVDPGDARYSPMFSLQPSSYWQRRWKLSAREKARLSRQADRRLAGRIPRLSAVLRRSPASRFAWGRELGRRFRDRIRGRYRYGHKVTSWQFDEVASTAAGSRGRAYRGFVRGVLHGLTHGRPSLGDGERRGIVYITQTAMRLGRRPVRGELRRFFTTLNRSTLGIAGEEYPEFTGSPSAAAARQDAGRRSLAQAGRNGRALERKYLAAITPGQRMYPGLGGNVARRSRGAIRRWRLSYVRRRARRVSGFAAYHFRFGNSQTWVMRDTLAAVARGARLVQRR